MWPCLPLGFYLPLNLPFDPSLALAIQTNLHLQSKPCSLTSVLFPLPQIISLPPTLSTGFLCLVNFYLSLNTQPNRSVR